MTTHVCEGHHPPLKLVANIETYRNNGQLEGSRCTNQTLRLVLCAPSNDPCIILLFTTFRSYVAFNRPFCG